MDSDTDIGDDTSVGDALGQDTDGDVGGDVWMADADARCENCAHYPVCAIFKGFAPMLEREGIKALDPEDLAKICELYEEE